MMLSYPIWKDRLLPPPSQISEQNLRLVWSGGQIIRGIQLIQEPLDHCMDNNITTTYETTPLLFAMINIHRLGISPLNSQIPGKVEEVYAGTINTVFVNLFPMHSGVRNSLKAMKQGNLRIEKRPSWRR